MSNAKVQNAGSQHKTVTKTANGFDVKPDPAYESTKTKAKGQNQLDRIEAKLDLIADQLGIKI